MLQEYFQKFGNVFFPNTKQGINMITEKIFKIYQKHQKKILITWLVIALACTPGAYFITKASSKTELSFLPRTESWEGLELLAEKFPNHGKSSCIIVLNGTKIALEPLTQELVMDFTEQFNNSEDYPEIINIYSIYAVLEQIQELYNATVQEVLKTVANDTPEMVTTLHEELYQLNNTLKQTIDMFQTVPYIYASLWWNISRFVFYTANQTLAFQRGNLNNTEISLLSSWLQMDNETIEQYFGLTLATGIAMYSLPFLGDNITSVLTFEFLNNLLETQFDTYSSGLNLSYTDSPLRAFLVAFNNSFTEMITNSFHANNTAIIMSYYAVNNPTYQDLALGFNSSLVTLDKLLQLVPSVLDTAGQTLLNNYVTSDQQIYNILATAYNLRYSNYASDPAYSSSFMQLAYSLANEQIDDYLELGNISEDFSINASEILKPEDILLFLSFLYQSPYPLDSTTLSFIVTMIVSEVESYIRTTYPPPASIGELDHDIYSTFVSADNNTILLLINLNAETGNEKVASYTEDFRTFLQDRIKQYDMEMEFHITGDMALTKDILDTTKRDVGKVDIFTSLFVFSFLLIIFMSPIAPFVPLITIGMAIAVVYTMLLGILALGLDFPTLMLSITTVVMMGAGVDYCIFMIYRYIEEREKGQEKAEATKSAFKHISETVLTSGLTVMVGFGSLLYTQITFINRLGLGPVIGVLVSLAFALSAIPSILLLLGDKLFWPRFNKKVASIRKRHDITSTNEKIARWTVKHPWIVVVILLLIFSPFIYYGATVTTSYDLWDQLPKDADSVVGANILEEQFHIGDLVPTEIVISWPSAINCTEDGIPDIVYLEAVRLLVARINPIEGIDVIKTVVQPSGVPLNILELSEPSFSDIMMIRQYFSADNTTIRIEVILASSPYSTAAINTVESIKSVLANATETIPALENAYIVVTGGTAIYQDLDAMLSKDTPIIIGICLSGVFVILLFLLGSIFAPVILELTILLSVLVSLGVAELIFHHVFALPIMWFLPVMLFVILFGLGMDFDILLVTRIKEETNKGLSNDEAIVNGVKHTASIITSAGFIMAGAFSALLLAKMTSLKVMGFTIAFAILLDATVVRIFLVPAIMAILGKWNWWPNKRLTIRKTETEEK